MNKEKMHKDPKLAYPLSAQHAHKVGLLLIKRYYLHLSK